MSTFEVSCYNVGSLLPSACAASFQCLSNTAVIISLFRAHFVRFVLGDLCSIHHDGVVTSDDIHREGTVLVVERPIVRRVQVGIVH